MNLHIKHVLAVVFLLTFHLTIASGATVTNSSSCRDLAGTEISLRPGVVWIEKDDCPNLRRAQLGCRIHYSEYHRLIRFVKRSELSYHAVCRKEKTTDGHKSKSTY